MCLQNRPPSPKKNPTAPPSPRSPAGFPSSWSVESLVRREVLPLPAPSAAGAPEARRPAGRFRHRNEIPLPRPRRVTTAPRTVARVVVRALVLGAVPRRPLRAWLSPSPPVFVLSTMFFQKAPDTQAWRRRKHGTCSANRTTRPMRTGWHRSTPPPAAARTVGDDLLAPIHIERRAALAIPPASAITPPEPAESFGDFLRAARRSFGSEWWPRLPLGRVYIAELCRPRTGRQGLLAVAAGRQGHLVEVDFRERTGRSPYSCMPNFLVPQLGGRVVRATSTPRRGLGIHRVAASAYPVPL